MAASGLMVLYAKGLTTGDIAGFLEDNHGQRIDRATISRITDGIVEDMGLWQSRPLDSIYPVLLVDGIKIRDGTVTNRVVYVVMGINLEGERDILGLWVGPTGGESITRARDLPDVQHYLARKRAEGKTRSEARRAHKRHLANRVIRRMWKDEQHRQRLESLAA